MKPKRDPKTQRPGNAMLQARLRGEYWLMLDYILEVDKVTQQEWIRDQISRYFHADGSR